MSSSRPLPTLTALAALAVLAACSTGGAAAHDAPASTDSATDGVTQDRRDAPRGIDARGTDAATASGFPATLTFGAATATLPVAFDETTTGQGSGALGAVAITNDVGTLGESGVGAAAFLYEQQPFGGTLTLYQGFAVSAASWNVFWLYCEGATLVDIWDEGIDGPRLAGTSATGACSAVNATTTSEHVALPALSVAAPTPVAGGYTVTGADITVAADGTGSVVVGGARLPLVVFGNVDCSTTCGSPGWYELHSLLWDEAHQRAVFVIIYLETQATTTVSLEYARSLPDLGDPIGQASLAATWTAAPTTHVSPADAARPHGMPPRS